MRSLRTLSLALVLANASGFIMPSAPTQTHIATTTTTSLAAGRQDGMKSRTEVSTKGFGDLFSSLLVVLYEGDLGELMTTIGGDGDN